jgi:hypothetical protein
VIEIMTDAKLKQLRGGVEETTEMTFSEFVGWWRTMPPLFDDAPMHRRMSWDQNLENAVRTAIEKEVPEAAKKHLEAADDFRKPCRAWMGIVVRVVVASNRPDELQRKLASMAPGARSGLIDPSWLGSPKPPSRLIQPLPAAGFQRPQTIRERAES